MPSVPAATPTQPPASAKPLSSTPTTKKPISISAPPTPPRSSPTSTRPRTSAPRPWPSPNLTPSSKRTPTISSLSVRKPPPTVTSRNSTKRRLSKNASSPSTPQTSKPPTPLASSTGCRPTQTPSKYSLPRGLTDDGQGNVKLSPASCEALRTANAELVDDALSNLTRAVDLKPDYADAMSYLNLILLRRADLHCGEDPAFVANDLRLAGEWSEKAAQVRQQSKPPDTQNTSDK